MSVLERAAAAFEEGGDADGQLRACSEGLSCAFGLWSFTEITDTFLGTIQKLLSSGSTISETTRLRALTGAVVGLHYRAPTDMRLPLYAEEVMASLPRIRNRDQALKSAIPVLEYFYDLGAFERSEQIIRMIEPLPGECSPALRCPVVGATRLAVPLTRGGRESAPLRRTARFNWPIRRDCAIFSSLAGRCNALQRFSSGTSTGQSTCSARCSWSFPRMC